MVSRIINAWHDYMPSNSESIIYLSILLVVFLALSIFLLANRKSTIVLEKISNNLLIVSTTIWLLGAWLYLIGFYRSDMNCLVTIPRAIMSSFKMFLVVNELARIKSELQNDEIYMTAFTLVHSAAAFIAFLFIFKMIGYKIKSSLKVKTHKWFHAKGKTVHLFWGVNEASCLLAEDIRKKSPADTIIFIDVDEERDDNTQKKATLSNITNTITIKNSEMIRIDAIGALVDHCYNGPAALNGDNETDIFGHLHLRDIGDIVKKSIAANFYFLSNDEATNIAGALNLQKDRFLLSIVEKKPVIYIHARRDANNEIFDHYSQYDSKSQRIKIKIVDSAYLSIATLKQDKNALPVNCIKFDETTGFVDTPFTALIIGFGGTGQEAFKFLYEHSAFVGSDKKKSPFKCYAIDEKMNCISGLIREKMPAIGEDELSLVNASIDSTEFWSTINKIVNELNYVVIAVNNDATGLSLAVNLFKYALKKRPQKSRKLKIMVRCYKSCNEKRMAEVAGNLNNSIDGNAEIFLFGLEKDLYCYNTVLSDASLAEAKEFNKVYENSELSADEQWEQSFGKSEISRLIEKKNMSRYHAIYDINRRIAQNISNSTHSHTILVLMGIDNNEHRLAQFYDYVKSRKSGTSKYKCNTADATLLLNAAMVEHERWIASHKLMGYTYSETNNHIEKHHKYICPWEEVDETTQSYDCNIVDTTIKIAYKQIIGQKKK